MTRKLLLFGLQSLRFSSKPLDTLASFFFLNAAPIHASHCIKLIPNALSEISIEKGKQLNYEKTKTFFTKASNKMLYCKNMCYTVTLSCSKYT